MTEQIIHLIEKPDGTERVYIVRRMDGCYSYRRQWQDDASELGWTQPGVCVGIYDSVRTAMWEALCRVDWLASVAEPN